MLHHLDESMYYRNLENAHWTTPFLTPVVVSQNSLWRCVSEGYTTTEMMIWLWKLGGLLYDLPGLAKDSWDELNPLALIRPKPFSQGKLGIILLWWLSWAHCLKFVRQDLTSQQRTIRRMVTPVSVSTMNSPLQHTAYYILPIILSISFASSLFVDCWQ